MFLLVQICFIMLIQENYTMKDILNKKKFVENLKQDLRRNNDDYVEMRRSFSQANNSQQSVDHLNVYDVRYKTISTNDDMKLTELDQNHIIKDFEPLKVSQSNNNLNDTEKEDVRMKIVDNIRRKVNEAFVSKEVINDDDVDPQRRAAIVRTQDKVSKNDDIPHVKTQPKMRSMWSDMRNLFQKNHFNINLNRMRMLTSKTISETTQSSTLRTIPTAILKNNKTKQRHVKKRKMKKFKEFIEKNKGLIREFIKSKKASTISPAVPATQHMSVRYHNTLLRGRGLNNVKRKGGNHKKSMEELPNAAVLDMFPAKGGRIHAKRVKGRLCHRHVLIPEGPKYNSLGRIYLPPHAAAHVAHEYNSTEEPKLLLPRCCNCCQKSVLGCA